MSTATSIVKIHFMLEDQTMKFSDRWLILTSLCSFWITISHEQYVCNDSSLWANGQGFSCLDYVSPSPHHYWCQNGFYIPSTLWTGGSYYKYPEFNCCGCGKGWPLWFVPAATTTATHAVPISRMNITNNFTSDNLICHDAYRNITACTMKCKGLQNGTSVTSINTISTQDFNESSCTLHLDMENNSLQYILEIPTNHYLIYFTNWNMNGSNLSCVNSTGLITSHMLCRYEIEEQPSNLQQCPSNSITNRYFQPDCTDTFNWTSTDGHTCFDYEIVWSWCPNRQLLVTSENLGSYLSYPERNCCACGKGSLSVIPSLSSLPISNSSIRSTEFGIIDFKNCSTRPTNNNIFNMKCLVPLNFTNTNKTMSATLYNCPLDCFFNWNTTRINTTQGISVSRYINGPSVSYYFASNILSRDPIFCGAIINPEETSTNAFIVETTSQEATTAHTVSTTKTQSTLNSQFMISTDSSFAAIESSSEFPTTTKQSLVWIPVECTNGKIGSNCSISADPCLMSEPCLNNGTCLNINSSYICLCPLMKFMGTYCEIDIRPCKPYTCLDHGQCIEVTSTTFLCQCEPGYEGIHCESLINYCQDVKCQNKAQCRPVQSNFTCECTSKDFSGRYCEIQGSSIITKQTMNRSLGYIAIIALVLVGGTIISMDILKYVFRIDPVDRERKRLRVKKHQKCLKQHTPIRFIYIDQPES